LLRLGGKAKRQEHNEYSNANDSFTHKGFSAAFYFLLLPPAVPYLPSYFIAKNFNVSSRHLLYT